MNLPESIIVYDAERELGWVDPDLDYPYIDRVAREFASSVAPTSNGVAEAAYQPGDGTFYGLVLVPLRLLETASPRVQNGHEWDAHACRGVLDSSAVADETGFPRPSGIAAVNALPYYRDGYLLVIVDGTSYPIRLGADRSRDLAASYVAEHWRLPATSAHSIAVLLRAVSYYLASFETAPLHSAPEGADTTQDSAGSADVHATEGDPR